MEAQERPTSEKPHEPVKATINASDKNIQLLHDIFTAWADDYSKPIIPNFIDKNEIVL